MPQNHLEFGGSTAHRGLRCAGSVSLCATCPPTIASPAMQRGTDAHSLLEWALKNHIWNISAPPEKLAGLDAEDVTAVQAALDYVKTLTVNGGSWHLRSEAEVKLGEHIGGTADVLAFDPLTATLHVIDYKHGAGHYVIEQDNPQLKLYAAAALASFPEFPAEQVNATIIQPRCGGQPIRTAVFSRADLMMYEDDVADAVALARSPNPPFTPGEEQCRWCPAAAVCSALKNAAGALSAITPDETAAVIRLPAINRTGDNTALAETLKVIPVIETWIDAVKARAFEQACAGVPVPGYKLVEKRASRKWADPEAVRSWFSSTVLDEEDFAPRTLVTPAQGEKLVKPLGKDAVSSLAALVVKESSGYNLVPESAKGDAVDPLALAAAGFSSAVALPKE